MDEEAAIAAFSALGQSTRLAVFRLLINKLPEGLAAGAIAAALKVPPNTMSSHLGILMRTGLVASKRKGRSVIYRADIDTATALLGFLVTNFCEGRPEMCGELLAALAGASRRKPKRKH